jgi:hypothetical protein
MLENFKIMRKFVFNFPSYSHPEICEISGCDKSTPLNGISPRDSKNEETIRREINKIIVIEVGRRSSSFVVSV